MSQPHQAIPVSDEMPNRGLSSLQTSGLSSRSLAALVPRWRDGLTRLRALSEPRSLLSSGTSYASKPTSAMIPLGFSRPPAVDFPSEAELVQLSQAEGEQP